MSRNGEGLDDIAHPDSEAESGDDGHHTLPGVRDVLKEHQFKAGAPRAPHPEALMKHAKKLNGWNERMNSVDEVRNVQPFLLSVIEVLLTIIVSTQDDVSESEDTAECQPMMDDETRKRGINFCLSLIEQDV